ncbi:hypothetical protein BDV25DRAFT_161464 [Aspergillus avenaceus]|uniref:Uncharacterized protein n=1 Tax=Aspergillus avenaceus TaxID=36643 RepID=A0A5N6TL16_ASPAV|nr:hypothetical protein BDV25DRAFT_161464 [Aspergillus avenaceus]
MFINPIIVRSDASFFTMYLEIQSILFVLEYFEEIKPHCDRPECLTVIWVLGSWHLASLF